MTIIKSLKGKTIKNIEYNNVYREKVVIDFTDGTTAFLYSYITGMHNENWPAMTATIIEETE